MATATPDANALGDSFVVNDFATESVNLTIGSLSPTFGAMSVALASSPSFTATSGATSRSFWNAGQNVAGGYSTDLFGSRVGVFGGYADRPTTFAPVASSSWNLGASLGYAGFYVRGAFTDVAERGLVDTWQSWQAGIGYGTENLDLRVSYVSSEASNGVARRLVALDTNQWMIGGIYRISSSIRVNADAFYGGQQAATPYGRLSAAPGASAPQGTGARVGVQLRF